MDGRHINIIADICQYITIYTICTVYSWLQVTSTNSLMKEFDKLCAITAFYQ